MQFVRFAAGTAYPRVAASFLRRSVEWEMHRRGLALPAQSLLLRHNVSACVFDEDIVWQLQELIAARRGAVITMGRGVSSACPLPCGSTCGLAAGMCSPWSSAVP